MELKISIGYNELFELIRQLPPSQIFQLQVDLFKLNTKKAISKEEKPLKNILLNGPTMNKQQDETFESNRKWINQWRTAR